MDASGERGRDRVLSCVALVAHIEHVNAFETAWREQLSRSELPDGLSMKEAMVLDKPLSGKIPAQSATDRIEALRPFGLLIRKHLPLAVLIGVDTQAFKQLPDDAKTRLGTKPDFLAFGSAMMASAYYLAPGDKTAIVSDDDEEIAWECYRFYRQLKAANAEFRNAVPCLSFANDKVFVLLQAADMLASLVRRESERIFMDRDYDFGPLLRAILTDTNPNEEIIRAHPWHWGTDTLKEMAKQYTDWGRRFPDALLPSLAADL